MPVCYSKMLNKAGGKNANSLIQHMWIVGFPCCVKCDKEVKFKNKRLIQLF